MGLMSEDHKHGLSDVDQDALIVCLRACAWGPSATADESTLKDNLFLNALEHLKALNVWIKNDRV